jgi:hypothetical protein
MLMNLFLAVVVENFSICFEPIEGLIEQEHVDHFLKVFAAFSHKEHRFSTLQEYLSFWNSQSDTRGESIYGNPADLIHRSFLQKVLAALRVNPNTGEQSGMTGYCNPLGGHLLGYHGRRHYLCVRAEIDSYIKEKMLREAPWSARMMKAVSEKWRAFSKKVLVWWLKLTANHQPITSSFAATHSLADRRAFVIRRFRKAAALAYRQSTGRSFSASKYGWKVRPPSLQLKTSLLLICLQNMVELLRQREQERVQSSLSREELFTILVTWSVPVTHLTEIERRNRHRIVEDIHKQSAQQLIHAMFVGRKVRALRQAANTNSKRKLFGATKFMMKTGKPVAPAAIQEDNFEEIECFRRFSSISKVPDKVTIAEEQDAFVRTCIKSRSQMISSKKLLEKVRSVRALVNDAPATQRTKLTLVPQIKRDCLASQMKLTDLACSPDDSRTASPTHSPRPNALQQLSPVRAKALYSNPALPGTPL